MLIPVSRLAEARGWARPLLGSALSRTREPRRFLQVLGSSRCWQGPVRLERRLSPRQVLEAAEPPSHYAPADDPALRDRAWIEAQRELSRLRQWVAIWEGRSSVSES